MNLQRKVYANRGEKVADFFIGVVIWHVVNILFAIALAAMTAAISSFAISGTAATSTTPNESITSILSAVSLVLNCLPFVVNIGLLIFFGVTRYWIALGMLGTFAFYVILAICALVVFGVACFAILGSSSGMGF